MVNNIKLLFQFFSLTDKFSDDAKVTKILLENSVDADAVNNKWNALHLAASYGKWIYNDKISLFQWFVYDYHIFVGRANLAKIIIENGADVNAVGNRQATALHISAVYGKTWDVFLE